MKIFEIFFIIFIITSSFNESSGKTFNSECEIVEVLTSIIEIDKIYQHLCAIDDRKVTKDTKKKNFYGIYRLGSEWWCGKTQRGGLCNTSCVHFLDDDIIDDALCAEKVLRFNKLKGWNKDEEKCLKKYQKVVHECLLNSLKTTHLEETTERINVESSTKEKLNMTIEKVVVTETTNFILDEFLRDFMCDQECFKKPLSVVALIAFFIFLLLTLVVCCKCKRIIE